MAPIPRTNKETIHIEMLMKPPSARRGRAVRSFCLIQSMIYTHQKGVMTRPDVIKNI